jgi:hypothetical protein
MTPELQDLAQRLSEVEKQVERLKSLVAGQSDTRGSERQDGTVEAHNFVVRDEQGRRRAELGMVTPAGLTREQPWLGFFDANDRVRACLGLSTDGPWFELYGANGKIIAEVREHQDAVRVALFDASGNLRIALPVTEDAAGAFLFSADAKQNLRLELLSSGQASLVMQDTNGEPGALVAVENGNGAVACFKDGKVVWLKP